MYFPPGRQNLQCYKILSSILMSSLRIFQKVPLLSNKKAANSSTAQCGRWMPPAFCSVDGSMFLQNRGIPPTILHVAVTCNTIILQNHSNSKCSGPKSLGFILFNFSMPNYKDLLRGQLKTSRFVVRYNFFNSIQ